MALCDSNSCSVYFPHNFFSFRFFFFFSDTVSLRVFVGNNAAKMSSAALDLAEVPDCHCASLDGESNEEKGPECARARVCVCTGQSFECAR